MAGILIEGEMVGNENAGCLPVENVDNAKNINVSEVYKSIDSDSQVDDGINSKPKAPEIHTENIPRESKACPNWTLWKYVFRKGKWTKVPYQPNKKEGDSSDPSKWTTYETAIDTYNNNKNLFDGIGFTFDPSGPFSGVDFDDCINEDGSIEPAVEGYLNKLNSYSEVSPSGKGIKVFTKAKLPVIIERDNGKIQQGFAQKKEKPEVEIYYGERFFTVTGNVLPQFSNEIEERNDELTEIFQEVFKRRNYFAKGNTNKKTKTKQTKIVPEIKPLSPEEADAQLQMLFAADETFKNNYCTPAVKPNRSDIEFGLCARMFEAGFDEKAVIRLMDGSPQSKWQEVGDHYRNRTIREAKRKVDRCAREMLKTPVILGPDISRNVDNCLKALYIYNNPPEIFQRTGGLCRIKTIDAEENRLTIENITPYALRIEMSKAATFKKGREDGKEVQPQADLANSVLANSSWDFPYLAGIINAPMIREDGSILDCPGYDESTGFYYVPSADLEVPEIPDKLTQNDAIRAANFILDEILIDFPFVDDASRDNMIAAFLSPVVRPMIKACVPICLIDKPSPGTGASKLVELVSLVTTGVNMGAVATPRGDEEEWKKLITTLLREGPALICLDNIESDIKSGNLASVLISSIWKSRLLGTSESVEYPNRACWYATGNKLVLDGDIPRRGYLIQLDAKLERPWEREAKSFKHSNINLWVKNNRGLILSKLLIMASAWVQAGKPAKGTDKTIGNFEDWTDIVGGILKFAGLNNFLGNLDNLYENLSTDNWTPFLTMWTSLHGDRELRSSEVCEMIEKKELLDCIPETISRKITGNKTRDATEVGKVLTRQVGVRRSNGLRLVKSQDPHTKSNLWRVLSEE